jgi:cytochrome b6-f complex iron-sulfur subunit
MAEEIATPQKEEKTKVNRREFLNIAFLASLGLVSLEAAGLTVLFAFPTFEEGEFGGVIDVGSISDLPGPSDPPRNEPKVKLWVSNTDQGVMGIFKVCTHLGCLYNWSEQEVRFLCPCHGSQFEKNGTYLAGPAPRSLDKFVVRIVDPDTGEVLAESIDGSPLPLPDRPDARVQVDTGTRIQGAPKG